ncbi:unnamed protein product [Schistosoma mattheei]|uniref:BTB domain-containing protein n=1 Tax=Schistosoma mattheei TaxID=31246 RepID=A0AA85B2L3_9TREM|nr:unnamed protein product [Schistosoma mattheei]
MCALINCQRASSKKSKAKIFNYFCKELSDVLECDPDTIERTDVTFVVGQNVYHGNQKTISILSEELKKCFQSESEDFDHSSTHGCILKVTRSKSSSSLKVFVDASADIFEAVLNYMLTLKLTVPEDLIPHVYHLSKCLQIKTLETTCIEFLIHNLSINSVGVLCSFIQFSGVYQNSNEFATSLTSYSPEMCLTKTLHHYLLTEADAIACSQTGILSARLIVNLTGNFDSSDDQNGIQEPSNEYLAVGVLRWAFEKLLTGERLARAGSEDNVCSDDEESDGNGSSHAVGNSNGSQRKRAGSQFQFLAQKNLLNGIRSKCGTSAQYSLASDDNDDSDDLNSETKAEERGSVSDTLNSLRYYSTQDIRISVDINDLPLSNEENEMSNISQNGHSLLTVCLTTGNQESETCLLAPTSLGVRSTSIWLGKLAGYLVSLSIKRCPPTHRSIQQLDQELMNEVNQSRSRHQSRGSSISNTFSIPNDLNSLIENEFNAVKCCAESVYPELPECTSTSVPKSDNDDEVTRTVTGSSASNLARAIVGSSLLRQSFTDQVYQSEILCISHNDGTGQDFPLHMLEARSSFGIGQLSCNSKHYIAIIGGYNRKGCLDSMELFVENNSNQQCESCSDEDSPVSPPIIGPRLTKQRGRLAVVSSYLQSFSDFPDIIYACGGSTGSKDLASVDKLTCEALESWLINHEMVTKSHHDNFDDHLYTNGSRRSSDFRTRTDSIANSHASSNGCGLSNVTFWQTIKSLHEARTNPVGVDLSALQQGPLITNTKGSVLVAGGVSDAQFLSSVEAYIPDRDEWIYMPSMLQGRCEACANVLTSRNLIVVIGGVVNTNTIYNTSQNVTVEALDPRCDTWFYIPNTLGNSFGQLRGASLTYCPNSKDNLLLVGGYNGHETLDTTWIFDSVAWKWRSGPNLIFARSSCCTTLTSDQHYNLVFGGYNPSKFNTGFSDTIEMIF